MRGSRLCASRWRRSELESSTQKSRLLKELASYKDGERSEKGGESLKKG